MAAGVDSKAEKRRKDSELGGDKEGVGQCHLGGRALFLMLFLLIPAVMLIVWLLVGLATSPVPYPLENIDVEADDLSLLAAEPAYALVEEFLEAEDSEIMRLQLASAMEEASKDIQQIVASVSDEADSAPLNIDVEEEVHLLKDIMSVLSDTSEENNADGRHAGGA
ncbi:uncharacterized protein LOC119593531 [Penaeus monodon]|uniref:uncharacterized protein LOC119593531 n=1 Tax=Penaeus monodon TaxID=6687 RepID=UPI0018A7A850|nr:uncharacterized protein LOC119593531 [Penaeus monodon]